MNNVFMPSMAAGINGKDPEELLKGFAGPNAVKVNPSMGQKMGSAAAGAAGSTLGTIAGATLGNMIAPGIGGYVGASMGGAIGGALAGGSGGGAAAPAPEGPNENALSTVNETANQSVKTPEMNINTGGPLSNNYNMAMQEEDYYKRMGMYNPNIGGMR